MAGSDDRSFGRPNHEEGASVAGWAGPGSRELRARDIDDVRQATYGGVRRLSGRARAVRGAPPMVQFGVAVLVIVGLMAILGVLGALSGAGNDGRERVWDAVDDTGCDAEDGEVRATGWVDVEKVRGQFLYADPIAAFVIEITVTDDDGLVGEHDKRYPSTSQGLEQWRVDVAVATQRDVAGQPSCEFKLLAIGR